MKTKKLLLMFPFLFLVMGMMSGCEKTKCPNPTETIGIIRYMPPPDNCNAYIIEIDGKPYMPDYLRSDFEKDNLPVIVTYCLSQEKHNCGFGGYIPIIHIEKIRRK